MPKKKKPVSAPALFKHLALQKHIDIAKRRTPGELWANLAREHVKPARKVQYCNVGKKDRLKGLDIKDAPRLKYSKFHKVCLEVLEDGYHQTYEQLVALIVEQRDYKNILILSTGCMRSLEGMVESDSELLQLIREKLCEAERASRLGLPGVAYNAYRTLGTTFWEEKHDMKLWMANRFFKAGLAVVSKWKVERMEGEACYYLARTYEKMGNLERARRLYEKVFKLIAIAPEQTGKKGSKETIVEASSKALFHIYSSFAQVWEKTNPKKCRKLMMTACHDEPLWIQGLLKLGTFLQKKGDFNTTIDMFQAFDKVRNWLGPGSHLQGIAPVFKLLAKKGDFRECVKVLKSCTEMAKGTQNYGALALANIGLGEVYNEIGDFEDATSHYDKAYSIHAETGIAHRDQDSRHLRTLYGIAKGNALEEQFAARCALNDSDSIRMLQQWKSNRSMEFRHNKVSIELGTQRPCDFKTDRGKEISEIDSEVGESEVSVESYLDPINTMLDSELMNALLELRQQLEGTEHEEPSI